MTVVVDGVGKRRERLHSVLRKRAWDDVRFDCILVDPPRRGFDDATLGALAGLPQVLIVACNPEKLARDCDVLLRTHAVAAFAVVDELLARRTSSAWRDFVRIDGARRGVFLCVRDTKQTIIPTKTACEAGPPRGSWRVAEPRHPRRGPVDGRVTSTFDTADARRTNAQASSKAPGSRGWSSSSYFDASAAGGIQTPSRRVPTRPKIASVAPTPSVFRRNSAPDPWASRSVSTTTSSAASGSPSPWITTDCAPVLSTQSRTRSLSSPPTWTAPSRLPDSRLDGSNASSPASRLEARVIVAKASRAARRRRRGGATPAAARGPRPSSRRRRRGDDRIVRCAGDRAVGASYSASRTHFDAGPEAVERLQRREAHWRPCVDDALRLSQPGLVLPGLGAPVGASWRLHAACWQQRFQRQQRDRL